MNNYKGILKAYLRRKIWLPLVLALAIPTGFYLIAMDTDLSVNDIRIRLSFPIQSLLVLPIIVLRARKLILVSMDLFTGCKTKTMVVKFASEEGDFMYTEKGKKSSTEGRYSVWKVKTEQGRILYVIQDCITCDDSKIIRGNWHTVELMYYSNFLLKVEHGKKLPQG